MCGRYTKEITDHIANYHKHLRDFLERLDAVSQYNVAPATFRTLRCADGDKTFVQDAKCGLIPFWSKDGKGYQITTAVRIWDAKYRRGIHSALFSIALLATHQSIVAILRYTIF